MSTPGPLSFGMKTGRGALGVPKLSLDG